MISLLFGINDVVNQAPKDTPVPTISFSGSKPPPNKKEEVGSNDQGSTEEDNSDVQDSKDEEISDNDDSAGVDNSGEEDATDEDSPSDQDSTAEENSFTSDDTMPKPGIISPGVHNYRFINRIRFLSESVF